MRFAEPKVVAVEDVLHAKLRARRADSISGELSTPSFNGDNLGFGKAHNLVLSECLDRSRYHLVLNPDVYFEPDVLEKLFTFMEEHPQAGLVMPKVLYPMKPSNALQTIAHAIQPGDPAIFSIPDWTRKMNDVYELKESEYNQLMKRSFSFRLFHVFMRNRSVKKTGLFDERFFLYAEDTDLSRGFTSNSKPCFIRLLKFIMSMRADLIKTPRSRFINLISAMKYFTKWGGFSMRSEKQ